MNSIILSKKQIKLWRSTAANNCISTGRNSKYKIINKYTTNITKNSN